MFLADFNQILHFVFTVLAVVVFEIEVFGHEGVQPENIQEVVDVVPLGPVLLVQLLLFQAGCY